MPDATRSSVKVTDLLPGDRVEELSEMVTESSTSDPTFVYAVDAVERINDHRVHVFMETDTEMSAAISYGVDDVVTVLNR